MTGLTICYKKVLSTAYLQNQG